MTKNELIALALRRLQEDPSEVKREGVGICAGLRHELEGLQLDFETYGPPETGAQQVIDDLLKDSLCTALQPAFLDWPEHSGNDLYPIPVVEGIRSKLTAQLMEGISSGLGVVVVDEMDAYKAFTIERPDLGWSPDHPYGAARLRLLQHLIDWYEGRAGEQQDQEES